MNYRVTFAAKNGHPEQTATFRSQALADAYARQVCSTAASTPPSPTASASGTTAPASSSATADDAPASVDGQNHD